MDKGFFKIDFRSSRFFIFKKFNISDDCVSDKLAPFVTAPDVSILSFLSKSSTPFNPTLSNLSIALITFNS